MADTMRRSHGYPVVEAGSAATGSQDEVKLDVFEELLRTRNQFGVAVVVTETRKSSQKSVRS